MAGFRPQKPPPTSPLFAFLGEVWDLIWGGKFPLQDTDSVKWSRSAAGYAAHASLPSAGGKSSPVKSDYAGIFVHGETYDALEWVLVQNGTAAGAYISTADNNTNDPITGINWVQFSWLPQWF